jgi:hypothetical protein
MRIIGDIIGIWDIREYEKNRRYLVERRAGSEGREKNAM